VEFGAGVLNCVWRVALWANTVPEFNARSGARKHRESFKTRSGRFQNLLKIKTRDASGGLSGAGLFQVCERLAAEEFSELHFGASRRLWGAVSDPVGFGRGPKITLFQHKST
jgi:hypothetical protein